MWNRITTALGILWGGSVISVRNNEVFCNGNRQALAKMLSHTVVHFGKNNFDTNDEMTYYVELLDVVHKRVEFLKKRSEMMEGFMSGLGKMLGLDTEDEKKGDEGLTEKKKKS